MSYIKIKAFPILRLLNGKFDFGIDQPYEHVGIKDPLRGNFSGSDHIWQPKEINSFLRSHLVEFKDNIFKPADSFFSSVRASAESLTTAFNKEPEFMFENLKYNTGVFLGDDEDVLFFHIDKKAKTLTGVVFINDIVVAGYKDLLLTVAEQPVKSKMYLPRSIKQEHRSEVKDSARHFVDGAALVTFFRTYADHDVKIVSSKSSSKLNNVQYNNLNKDAVKVLDSSWYTSLVKTEGFMVKGHLKMQACGPNWSQRKLIYIEGFEKKGYVRRAMMLPRTVPGISEIL